MVSLLGLSGISGKYQDKREENLTIQNVTLIKKNKHLKIENILLKNNIKILEDKYVNNEYKLDSIINIPIKIDTFIVQERTYVPIELNGKDCVSIGIAKYPIIHQMIIDSFVSRHNKGNIIVKKGLYTK